MHMKKTNETRKVEAFLKEKFPNYPPDYPPSAYRTDLDFIHMRIVDRSFDKIPWPDRVDVVNPILHLLPERIQSDITRLFLFAPDEVERSGSNYEFEHPTPAPRFPNQSRNGSENRTTRKQRTSRGAKS